LIPPYNTFMQNIQALIIDMDGVLWRDTQPLIDLPAVFQSLHARGLDYILATNNATKRVDQYVSKIKGFGLEIAPEKVVTSAVATAEYLFASLPAGDSIFAVGEEGLYEALGAKGFRLEEKGAHTVVVGLDRDFSYQRLLRACLLIRDGARFVGTNPDLTYPIPEGLAPGAGSLIRAVEAAAGVEAEIVGKPGPLMFAQAMQRMGSVPANTLVVGDRLETDIQGGQAAGCRTAVVLTGVATRNQAQAWRPQVDYIAENLQELVEQL